MLIDQIRDDMFTARKGTDTVAKNLLVTLYSEAQRVGKDKRNGVSTDEECVAVIRKFLANAEETVRLLHARGQSSVAQTHEVHILTTYLPTQLTEAELAQIVQNIVAELNLSGAKVMGTVMAELKARHAGAYDGKLASQVVKTVLG